MLKSIKTNLIISGLMLFALVIYCVVAVSYVISNTQYRYLVASDTSRTFTIIDSRVRMTKDDIPYDIDRYWDMNDLDTRCFLTNSIIKGVFDTVGYDTYYDDRIHSAARVITSEEFINMIICKEYSPKM